MCNGILAGLVSVTASCSVVEPLAAVAIGIVGAGVYALSSHFVLNVFRLDDVVDAISIHGACGFWSMLAPALFASTDYTYGGSPGLFYGGGKLLGAAVIAILVIVSWSSSIAALVFRSLSSVRKLRIPAEEEIVGMDRAHHGGCAYGADATEVPNYEHAPSYQECPAAPSCSESRTCYTRQASMQDSPRAACDTAAAPPYVPRAGVCGVAAAPAYIQTSGAPLAAEQDAGRLRHAAYPIREVNTAAVGASDAVRIEVDSGSDRPAVRCAGREGTGCGRPGQT